MKKSSLEGLSNSHLFFILKIIVKEHPVNTFTPNDIGDEEFIDLCVKACKIMGINTGDYIDCNYILATLIINRKFDFTTQKPSGTIIKPKIDNYSFDIKETRSEVVVRTYRHKTTSYLSDLVIPYSTLKYNNDELDIWTGKEVDVEYIDGETDSVDFEGDSVTKL
jgi:hypothetical protein